MRPRGFTLVELLVTISVLTLLTALLLPALGAARERTKAALCASQVRQLLLGMSNYEAANETFPPGFQPAGLPAPPGPYAGSPVIDLVGKWWFDFSEKVDHESQTGTHVLECPSKRQRDPRLVPDILCGNYGANLSICRADRYLKTYREEFSGRPLSSHSIPQPGATLLLVDSGYSLISWWHATAQPPEKLPEGPPSVGYIQHTAYVPGLEINHTRTLWPGQTEDALGGRHPHKTVNVGFVDGHVARKGADELLVERTADGQWNSGPLWQPGRDRVIPQGTTP